MLLSSSDPKLSSFLLFGFFHCRKTAKPGHDQATTRPGEDRLPNFQFSMFFVRKAVFSLRVALALHVTLALHVALEFFLVPWLWWCFP
jgi:hypothetical protein